MYIYTYIYIIHSVRLAMTVILQLASCGEFCVYTLYHIFLMMTVSFKMLYKILLSGLYRVIREEKSIFWEVVVLVIV